MQFKHVWLLPIIVNVWFPLTFILTYVIAVWRKDVFAVFPYISDTGNWSPESCIFGLMLNIGAIMQGLIMYARYRQVRQILTAKETFGANLSKLNKICWFLAVQAVLGVIIVGNFQETNVFVVHVMGAMMAFGLGTGVLGIQTYLSFKMYPTFGTRNMNFMRLFLLVVCCLSLNVSGVTGLWSMIKFEGDDITKWKQSDGGYILHLISAGAEWILAICSGLFFLTFTGEFRTISFSEPVMKAKEEVENGRY